MEDRGRAKSDRVKETGEGSLREGEEEGCVV